MDLKLLFRASLLLSISTGAKINRQQATALFDVFGSGRKEWALVFRGTSGIGQSAYEAYVTHQSGGVEDGCRQFSSIAPCRSHYRDNAALDNWRDVHQVAFVLYTDGLRVAHVLFDGQGSDFLSWFNQTRIIASSFEDLESVGKIPHFLIRGGPAHSFLIHGEYGKCKEFEGWTAVIDRPNHGCPWESRTGDVYPRILYRSSGKKSNMSGEDVVPADAFAVFLKSHEICHGAMEQVQLVPTTSHSTSNLNVAFEVSPNAKNEQIVEITVTGDDKPTILTPSTDLLTSPTLSPNERKAVIANIGTKTRLDTKLFFKILKFSEYIRNFKTWIVPSPAGNKAVAIFPVRPNFPYDTIVDETLQLYDLEEYQSVDQVPDDEVPVIVITKQGAEVSVKKCSESTKPDKVPKTITPIPFTPVTSIPTGRPVTSTQTATTVTSSTGHENCHGKMELFELVPMTSESRSNSDVAFMVSPNAKDEQIVEITVTGDDKPTILTPSTDLLTSSTLSPNERKAVIANIGEKTRLDTKLLLKILKLTSNTSNLTIWIVPSEGGNKAVAIFPVRPNFPYDTIVDETLQLFDLEEYQSIDQVPKEDVPVIFIAKQGAQASVKICAESTKPANVPTTITPTTFSRVTSTPTTTTVTSSTDSTLRSHNTVHTDLPIAAEPTDQVEAVHVTSGTVDSTTGHIQHTTETEEEQTTLSPEDPTKPPTFTVELSTPLEHLTTETLPANTEEPPTSPVPEDASKGEIFTEKATTTSANTETSFPKPTATTTSRPTAPDCLHFDKKRICHPRPSATQCSTSSWRRLCPLGCGLIAKCEGAPPEVSCVDFDLYRNCMFRRPSQAKCQLFYWIERCPLACRVKPKCSANASDESCVHSDANYQCRFVRAYEYKCQRSYWRELCPLGCGVKAKCRGHK